MRLGPSCSLFRRALSASRRGTPSAHTPGDEGGGATRVRVLERRVLALQRRVPVVLHRVVRPAMQPRAQRACLHPASHTWKLFIEGSAVSTSRGPSHGCTLRRS